MGYVARDDLPREGTVCPYPHEDYRPFGRVFAIGLVVILAGYAFLGRGFAYIHLPIGIPLYVGEMVLGIGLLMAVSSRRLPCGMFSSLPGGLLLCFWILAAVRTAFSLGDHGLMAIRDAAIWYYGIFAFLVYVIAGGRGWIVGLLRFYARPARYFVFWMPAAFLLYRFALSAIPRAPGSDVPLLSSKGDMKVHLAGVVAFFVLFGRHSALIKAARPSVLWYGAAFGGAIFFMGRGSFLAFACAMLVLFVLVSEAKRWQLVASVALAVVLLALLNPAITLPSGHTFSLETTSGLVKSIFTSTQDPAYREGSKRWRLRWWRRIADETFGGPYFWTGKGFGENLADAHGFQVFADRSLRSPHNGHMTILARMGVPGFLLWISLQLSLGWRFFSGWKRARAGGDKLLQGVLAWVLCFWTAALVNASFDVYLEGPQGAIWFWSVVGLGFVAAEQPVVQDNLEPSEIHP